MAHFNECELISNRSITPNVQQLFFISTHTSKQNSPFLGAPLPYTWSLKSVCQTPTTSIKVTIKKQQGLEETANGMAWHGVAWFVFQSLSLDFLYINIRVS